MFPSVPVAFKRKVRIQRTQPGSYIDGRYSAPANIESDLIGSVQPAAPEDLRKNPFGEDVTEGIKIYTDNTNNVKATDLILDQGNTYMIISVLPWNYHGYYKIVAGLISD